MSNILGSQIKSSKYFRYRFFLKSFLFSIQTQSNGFSVCTEIDKIILKYIRRKKMLTRVKISRKLKKKDGRHTLKPTKDLELKIVNCWPPDNQIF